MRYLLNRIFLIIFFLIYNNCLSQNIHNIDAEFLVSNNNISVKQLSVFKNETSKNLSKLIIYDWNNSYSSISTPLSKKLYSEYDTSLLKSDLKKKGSTIISKILINNKKVNWKRVENHEDLIEIQLSYPLKIDSIIQLEFEYELIIPSLITNYGNRDDVFFNLSNCFFRFSPFIDGKWLIKSNLGFNDQLFDKAEINLNFKFNSDFNVISNLNNNSLKNTGTNKVVFLNGFLVSDIYLFLTKQNEFQNITIGDLNLYTNSEKILNLDDNSFKKIQSFLKENFNQTKGLKNIIFEQNHIKKHSLLPYSEIPSLIDPFDENILAEINLMKNIIRELIKNSSTFDFREMYWLFTGIELFYLEKYIEQYYNDLTLIGKFSKLFFIKKYNVSLYKFNTQFKLAYNFVSSKNLNQPISLSADKLTRINYKLSNPAKSLYSLKLLNNYIGLSSFNSSLLKILNGNKFIHNNQDLKKIFQKSSSLNLDWFFDNYIHSDKLIDFKIFKKNNELIIKNKLDKDLSFPIPVEFEYTNNEKNIFWINQNKEFNKITFVDTIKSVRIDPNRLLLEENYSNNDFSNNNNNNNKIKFKFFLDLDNPNYNQIFYRPQFLYNLYDGFSPGITLTNKSPFKKRFTYIFSPYYATNSESIVGSLSMNFISYNSKIFSSNYSLSLSKFNYNLNQSYFRFSPTIVFSKRSKNLVSNYKQYLRLKYVGINRNDIVNNSLKNKYGISRLTYINSNPGAKKSYSFSYDLQFNNEIIKNSITFNYRNYFSDFRQYNIRLFVGKFFKNNNLNGSYNFSVDRPSDYLFNNFLLGRSEQTGFYSQQYVRYEGAFKSRINITNPNEFILSINSGITIWKWFEAYFDYGLFKNKGESFNSGFDSGFRLNIIENFFELFFPIYSSKDFYLTNNSYNDKIRFVLTFDYENLSNLFTRRWF